MLMPGPHAFIMLGLGFETMGVPAMKVDGRRVQGSRAISRALDEIVPEKPLFPADPKRRKAVQDAERWARTCRTPRAGSSTAPRGATTPRSGAS